MDVPRDGLECECECGGEAKVVSVKRVKPKDWQKQAYTVYGWYSGPHKVDWDTWEDARNALDQKLSEEAQLRRARREKR
jgi:hypothetical protein